MQNRQHLYRELAELVLWELVEIDVKIHDRYCASDHAAGPDVVFA